MWFESELEKAEIGGEDKNFAGEKICLKEQTSPLKTKRRLLYLKTQFVPRSKHFSSRL